MAMTQIAFLSKADLPTNGQMQLTIQDLGYDFKIRGNQQAQIDQKGLECSISGHQTFFETYLDDANDVVINEGAGWIKQDLTNQDTAITFVWGADFAAGGCIGLISIALIDLSDALIYYVDDQMKYTREMLIADIPQYLEELNKQPTKSIGVQNIDKSMQSNSQTKSTFLNQLKNLFK